MTKEVGLGDAVPDLEDRPGDEFRRQRHGVVSIELEEAVTVLDSYTDTILDDLISIRPLLDSLTSSKRVFSTIQQYTMDGAVYILAVC